MPKILIIAEKPSVAREIAALVNARQRRQGWLEGDAYRVSWAVGHLVGIAEPEEQNQDWKGAWRLEQLPMLPPRFKLAVLQQTADQFAVLQSLLTSEDTAAVINATDAGREGELIFRRIYLMAGATVPVKRLWANDMTEEGLKKSLANLLLDADKRNLGLASFARAEADWLVGMNFSRLFSVKAHELVSVGRVQSPVLCILAERRKNIENFTSQEFWTVEATFALPNVVQSSVQVVTSTSAGNEHNAHASPAMGVENTENIGSVESVESIGGKSTEGNFAQLATQPVTQPETFTGLWHRAPEFTETRVENQEEALQITTVCSGKKAKVAAYTAKAGKQQPPLLFDLTTLQREANVRFGYSAKDTLTHVQSLYETYKLLTYPRTDSRYITQELFAEIVKPLRAIYHLHPEESALVAERVKKPKAKFVCVNNSKVTDHHAIIPTGKKANMQSLPAAEAAVYEMVCRRFLAAFMPEAIFATAVATLEIEAEGTFVFIAKGKVYKDRGWMKVEPWRTTEDAPLPALRKGAVLSVAAVQQAKGQTKAPPHFTDASLLAAMETAGKLVEDEELRDAMKDRGLGTPATRAQVIETLLQRGYVEKDGKRLVASAMGMQVAEALSVLLPDVASPEMTGLWEKKLKDIEAGSFTYPEFMHEIRKFVHKGVHDVKNKPVDALLDSVALQYGRPYDGQCPLCGGEVVQGSQAWLCENNQQNTQTKAAKKAAVTEPVTDHTDDAEVPDRQPDRQVNAQVDAQADEQQNEQHDEQEGKKSRKKAAKKSCSFNIPLEIRNVTITEEYIAALLQHGKTAPVQFMSKNNKPYKACFALRNGKLSVRF